MSLFLALFLIKRNIKSEVAVMSMIKSIRLCHAYKKYDETGTEVFRTRVLDEIDIQIEEGQFVAILGHNGSGKSTLARHLNALLQPDKGELYIDGMLTKDVEKIYRIRQSCGMVFQNPDNQIIGATVEEDVAFGPENLGVKPEDIVKRVDESIEKVNMEKFRFKSPNHLSGGQKQRVAIASALAMKPKCIVLDEPTAMLDPKGRQDVMEVLRYLNRMFGITIILITHHMSEAVRADKIFVMNKGKVVMEDTPRYIFSHVPELKELKLEVPLVTEIAYELMRQGLFFRCDILTAEEFAEEFERVMGLRFD